MRSEWRYSLNIYWRIIHQFGVFVQQTVNYNINDLQCFQIIIFEIESWHFFETFKRYIFGYFLTVYILTDNARFSALNTVPLAKELLLTYYYRYLARDEFCYGMIFVFIKNHATFYINKRVTNFHEFFQDFWGLIITNLYELLFTRILEYRLKEIQIDLWFLESSPPVAV